MFTQIFVIVFNLCLSLRYDKFTKERLERTLHNCKNYESMGHKTRGNSNLMRAVEILIKQQQGA